MHIQVSQIKCLTDHLTSRLTNAVQNSKSKAFSQCFIHTQTLAVSRVDDLHELTLRRRHLEHFVIDLVLSKISAIACDLSFSEDQRACVLLADQRQASVTNAKRWTKSFTINNTEFR